MAGQIDQTISNEIAEIESNSGRGSLAEWRDAVSKYSQTAPTGTYYLLQNSAGRVLAGNIPSLDPIVGIRSWPSREDGGRFPRGKHSVRGYGILLADGAYLFVGIDSRELGKMRETITHAFAWGLAGTIFLALVGGAIMSLGPLRRIEAISNTSRDIIAGDLSRRIPIRGTDDEFDHLAISLNVMLDRIEGLMEGLRQVSNDIAHDLRTPLTRLRQRLELARRRARTVEEMHAALDGSIEDVDSILETFAAVLRIAQIEAHTKTADFQRVDLTEMLEDMIETYQSVAEEKGQELNGEIATSLSMSGDRELLPQLFSNLIENAIRHCPAGSRIVVTARRLPGDIVVSVADDGPGIPADMRDKVFQRFFRLERSRTTAGTGLGLNLAAAIAALHHARMELSDNHPGLRVDVIIPAPEQTV